MQHEKCLTEARFCKKRLKLKNSFRVDASAVRESAADLHRGLAA